MKHYRLSGLKKFFSQFSGQKSEIQVWFLPRPILVCRRLPFLRPQLVPLGLCVSWVLICSLKGTSPITGLVPLLRLHFTLITLLRPYPITVG